MKARSKNSVHSSSIQMLRLRRGGKDDDFLKDCHQLREQGLYTDMTIVTGDHKMVKVHSIMFASCSPFLSHWMRNNSVPDGQYSLVLPSATATDVSLLIGLLYGAKLSLRSRLAKRIQDVAEMLGIYVDLAANYDISNDFERNTSTVTTSTVTTSATNSAPPLCCWHCDQSFGSFDELRAHVDRVHQGDRAVASRRHKCTHCKKILPTTWKLRQHLLTHRLDQGKSSARTNTDHPYAVNDTTQKRSKPAKKSNSAVNTDHIYSAMASPPRAESPLQVLTNANSAPKPSTETTIEPAKETGQTTTALTTTKTPTPVKRPLKSASSSGFECELCGKAFPQRYRMARHMKEVHEQEKRHACRFCDKQFFKITSKVRHELTHTKHSRWSCPLCSKSFRDESGLRYHLNHRVCSNKDGENTN